MKSTYEIGNTQGWVGSQGYDANYGYYTTQAEIFGNSPIPCDTWIPYPGEISHRLRREMELERLEKSFWKRLKFIFITKIL